MKRVMVMALVLVNLVLGMSSVEAAQFPEKLDKTLVLKINENVAYVNNIPHKIDPNDDMVKPVILNGRTMLPVRFVAERLGAQVGWDDELRLVTVSTEDTVIKFSIGSKTITVNGESVESDTACCIINDRTFVPVRIFSEQLGKNVFYDREIVIISEMTNTFDKDIDKKIIDSFLDDYSDKAEKSTAEIVPEEEGVVIIYSFNEEGNLIGVGSGFFIREGIIATAMHVVLGAAYLDVETSSGMYYEVDGYISADLIYDTALLKLSEIPENTKALELSSKHFVDKGQEIITISSPLGTKNLITEGIVSSLNSSGDYDLFQFTASVDYGSSGGPVMDKHGEVIGMISGGYEENSNMNIASYIDVYFGMLSWLGDTPYDEVMTLGDFDSETTLPQDKEDVNKVFSDMINNINNEGLNFHMEILDTTVSVIDDKATLLSEIQYSDEGVILGTSLEIQYYRKVDGEWVWFTVDYLNITGEEIKPEPRTDGGIEVSAKKVEDEE